MNCAASKEDVRRFWEENPLMSGEFELDSSSREFFERHENLYREDVFPDGIFPDSFFPFPVGAMILDVGCGPGLWTRELARRGYAVSAIDLTQTAVELARTSLSFFGLSADVSQGDAEDLPFEDGVFDGIVSHGVIHHTPDTARCVAEMARVLKPGGLAVVSVYYRNLVLRSRLMTRVVALGIGRFVSLPGRARDNFLQSGDPDEIVRLYDGGANPLGKAYTAFEIEGMFRDAGFDVTGHQRFYFPARAFGQLKPAVRLLQPMLARHCGLMYAVFARKAAASRSR